MRQLFSARPRCGSGVRTAYRLDHRQGISRKSNSRVRGLRHQEAVVKIGDMELSRRRLLRARNARKTAEKIDAEKSALSPIESGACPGGAQRRRSALPPREHRYLAQTHGGLYFADRGLPSAKSHQILTSIQLYKNLLGQKRAANWRHLLHTTYIDEKLKVAVLIMIRHPVIFNAAGFFFTDAKAGPELHESFLSTLPC